MRTVLLGALLVLYSPSLPLAFSQDWRDPANHDAQFVSVEPNVSLEVLDWGGAGTAVVLLPGSGHSAHVFDDLAPKLTSVAHVYGITRRGWGRSSQPNTGYDNDRLAQDVVAVLDAFKLTKPVLMGHSAAGHEMTTVARVHPDRLGGLVYLDALGDSDSDPSLKPEWLALLPKLPPRSAPPSCGMDRSSFAAFRLAQACAAGFRLPEAEWRNTFNTDPDGSVGAYRTRQETRRAMGAGHQAPRDYSGIRVPVLALFEFPRTSLEQLRADDPQPRNEDERAFVLKFAALTKEIVDRGASNLLKAVPNARLVNLPGGGHYVFVTREDAVIQERRDSLRRSNNQITRGRDLLSAETAMMIAVLARVPTDKRQTIGGSSRSSRVASSERKGPETLGQRPPAAPDSLLPASF